MIDNPIPVVKTDPKLRERALPVVSPVAEPFIRVPVVMELAVN